MWRKFLCVLVLIALATMVYGADAVYKPFGVIRTDTTKGWTDPSGIDILTVYTDTLNVDTVYSDIFELKNLKQMKLIVEFDAYVPGDTGTKDAPVVKSLVYTGPEKNVLTKLVGTITMTSPSDGDVSTLIIPEDSMLNWCRIRTVVQDSLIRGTASVAGSSSAWDIKYYLLVEPK